MNNLGDDFVRHRRWAGVLVVVQVVLTGVVFGPAPRSVFGAGLATAVFETQLLLAVIMYRLDARFRDCLIPLATLSLFSGCAGSSILCVEAIYPSLFAENFFVPLLIAIGATVALRGVKILWAETHDKPLPGANPRAVTLRSLFVWIAAVACGILISQGAILNTHVSDGPDPWESTKFASIRAPVEFLFRLPLLFAATALYGFIWAGLIRVFFSQDCGRRVVLPAAALFAGWFVGELVLGACVLCFKKPWPLLPVGMLMPVMVCWGWGDLDWQGRSERYFWSSLAEYAVFALYRVVILGGSLGMLRISGLRLRPGVETRGTRH